MKAKYRLRFLNIFFGQGNLLSIQLNEVKMEKNVIIVICSIAFNTLDER